MDDGGDVKGKKSKIVCLLDMTCEIPNNSIGNGRLETDYSNRDDCSDLTDTNDEDNEEQNARSFPEKLLEILSNEEIADVITWLPHGNGFIINKKKTFANEILPRYFKATKFTSFTRKLNRWGFSRAPRGPETGAYFHKLFRRDKPELCLQMTSNSGNKYHSTPVQPEILPNVAGMVPSPITPMPMFAYMPNPMIGSLSPQQQQTLWQQQMQLFNMQQMQQMQMMQLQQQHSQAQSQHGVPLSMGMQPISTAMTMMPSTMGHIGMAMGSMPMGSMPMGSMPMSSMSMGTMPMGTMPMGSMPMGSMPMSSMPMGSMPMGHVPIGQMPLSHMSMGAPIQTSAVQSPNHIENDRSSKVTTQTPSLSTFQQQRRQSPTQLPQPSQFLLDQSPIHTQPTQSNSISLGVPGSEATSNSELKAPSVDV